MLHLASLLCLVHIANAIVFTSLGRTYYSTNAVASAEFFQRYLGAKLLTQNVTNDTSCATVTSVISGDITVTFIEDKVKPDGRATASSAVEALTAQWKDVMDRKQLYSQWFDNHDGYGSGRFDVDKASEDGLEMQVYHDDKTPFPKAVVRTRIPGTAWTLETSGVFKIAEAEKLEKWRFADPDNCRNNSKQDNMSMPYWWKSTFASADPAAAAEFAVSVLGATPSHSPYPWPHRPNCTAATWVTLPNSSFMLHFVSSTEYSTAQQLSISDWAQSQERYRNLAAGVFDRQMYNALILWTDDLDPVIDRLQLLAVPFLPLQLGTNLYALQLDIPQNGFSIQIKSHRLTKAAPQHFDACAGSDPEHVLV